MPKLISDSKYRRLCDAERELKIIKALPKAPPQVDNTKQLEAIEARLHVLELALVQLAKILNPSVQNVEDGLKTAASFAGVSGKKN